MFTRTMGLFLSMMCLTALAAGQPHIDLSQSLKWRLIGPHRGGRTVGATGVAGQPNVFYIGVNNGGVWKTDDYGRTWRPIFDDQPTGSIGDVAVAPSDPKVIYVGTGEGLHRPDLSVGDGMFRSDDEGQSWRHIGLEDAQQIAAVAVHPGNADFVVAAVLGHPYGPNSQRGVFRTTNGGASWEKVLYIDENTGATAVAFDPLNPGILYAALWASREGPWENAAWEGTTSGLYKSVDNGQNWLPLTEGLPGAAQGLGRIGFDIARSDPQRLYATVDAREGGGIYRSDDAGRTWTLVNSDRRLWGRGGDFAEIKVHPERKDTVYVGNIAAYVSHDGGQSFQAFKGAPGGDDYHRIWINPDHPDIILMAADQGATITVNGGRSWSSWYNQPTAQLYHVTTDQQFPYRVYGGQQESGAIAVPSRGNMGQITFRDWFSVGADEYAYVAPDPVDPNIVYGGRVMRYDRRTGQAQNVAPEAIRSGRYRILRTMPLLFSPLDRSLLLFATNVLFATRDGGQHWEIISPDLSRPQPEIPESIGIFRTEEMSQMPRRGVIYAVSPSPLQTGLIWAGTDDGLVHVTRDGGGSWSEVTPPDLTAWSKVSQIDAGHFDPGTAYVAINRIRLDDMRPHIFRTHDGGQNWTRIVSGLPENGPVNVVREDPVRPGLLFAGTERAVYFSLDDGDSWQPLRINMPASSIRDLVVAGDDIVAGTHGRSIWILDNITPLRQLSAGWTPERAHLFEPQLATRVRWNLYSDTPLPPEEPAGQNPPDGAMIDYYLPEDAGQVTLEIVDQEGRLVRAFSASAPPEQLDPNQLPYPTYWIRPPQHLSNAAGLQRFVWDLHYPPPPGVRRSHPISAIHRNTPSGPSGPWVQPGRYQLRLTVDGQTHSQDLQVRLDPRVEVSAEALQQQFDDSMVCYRGYIQAYQAREQVERLQAQAQARMEAVPAPLQAVLKAFQNSLEQLAGQGVPGNPDIMYSAAYAAPPGEDTLARAQSRLLFLMAILQGADAQPTSQARRAVAEEQQHLNTLLDRLASLRRGDLASLNQALEAAGVQPLESSSKP